ncbi:hypothetical protein [Ferrimonas balearica]|uniref:hypothetical protein n=1 Tax=Ferrimonas balearica TaxID=44012 RepID=UPI001C99E457|nr:hypothetical protein [Ferrimonas balearica]MBY5992354.1 hypothetical protein [Ferrimonas balearica]
MRPLSRLLVLPLLLLVPELHAACTEPLWDSATEYQRRDRVTHQGHHWQAKRTSLGVTPGTHKPTWADQGQCEDPGTEPPLERTPMQIFGVWHAGNHYADWSLVRDMDEFDQTNRWIIDRGDGRPSVNLVVLSFLQPLEVLAMDSADPASGVPVGMTQAVVDYFKDRQIRVMMSIGGITYVDFWDQALAQDATQLGLNAAAIAAFFGVGMEIDYENASDPNLTGLQAFIDAYRSVHPYDPSGANPAARLTIDLAAGGRYLQDLNRHATTHWLDNANPVLDYANAMVHRASGTPSHWQEHVDGMPTYDPKIPPKAPNRFTGGLFLKGNMDNCTDFDGSEQKAHEAYVHTVAPNGAGTTPGMLGYMFWATGVPSARKNYVPTYPPNSCEGGMGVAATVFEVPIPMEPLRQQ